MWIRLTWPSKICVQGKRDKQSTEASCNVIPRTQLLQYKTCTSTQGPMIKQIWEMRNWNKIEHFVSYGTLWRCSCAWWLSGRNTVYLTYIICFTLEPCFDRTAWGLLCYWIHMGNVALEWGFQALFSCCWYDKAEDSAHIEVIWILEKEVYQWCGSWQWRIQCQFRTFSV